jgi:flagellar hook-associated protein 1 FlgK
MLQTFGIGMSALAAAQRGIEVTSHNVANAGTVGYTRQRVEQAAAFPSLGTRPYRPGTYGAGVDVVAVRRMRDDVLTGAVLDAAAQRGGADEVAKAMASIQDIAGTLEDGIATDVSRLWSAWSDVAANPTGTTARAGVLDASNRLAASLRTASARLAQVESTSVQRMAQAADEVNSLSKEIAKLNMAIAEVTNSGGTPNDFLDKRDVAVERLVALTGGQTRTDGHAIDVTMGGISLVSGGTSSTMTVTENPPAVQVDGNPTIMGGALGALRELATSTVDGLRDRLDLVANGLRDAVNAQHTAGFDLDGNAGQAIFLGTSAADIHVDPALTTRSIAASRSGAAGDGNNAVALGDLAYRATVGTPEVPGTPSRTLAEAASDLVADIGRRAAVAQSEAETTSAISDALEQRRQEVSGVSIDEEMTNLLRYQRAYQAAARVITAADELLDTLINRVGLVGR